jgi:hypothetical protein
MSVVWTTGHNKDHCPHTTFAAALSQVRNAIRRRRPRGSLRLCLWFWNSDEMNIGENFPEKALERGSGIFA